MTTPKLTPAVSSSSRIDPERRSLSTAIRSRASGHGPESPHARPRGLSGRVLELVRADGKRADANTQAISTGRTRPGSADDEEYGQTPTRSSPDALLLNLVSRGPGWIRVNFAHR